MNIIGAILNSLSVKKQCKSYGANLRQCPNFLFLLMSVIVIVAIITSYLIAQSYIAEPEVVALIVLIIAAILFIIDHALVSSFERVAMSAKAKSEFISIISHQLRTPLSIIKWQLNLLNEKTAASENKKTRDFLFYLEKENQRMTHMVNDLLELNRIEDKSLNLRPSEFSLQKVVEEIAERRRKDFANNIVIETSNKNDNLPLVYADKIRIQEVVSNILDNAIKYSVDAGHIAIDFKILPRKMLCLIEDDGIGIPKEDLNKIFTKFFRAENTKYQTQGLGLRLYIAKAIVKASGGNMGFKTKSKGSIFWFTVPIAYAK